MNIDVDLRCFLPGVGDQGPRGTCLAFAVTGAHEYARRVGSNIVALSVEAIYWKARHLAGIPSGITFQSASDALESQGQPEDSKWPYDPLQNESDTDYDPPSTFDVKACYQGTLRRIDNTVEAIIDALDKHKVVVAGIIMSDSFGEDTAGVIRMPKASEIIQQGHGIVFVGYGKNSSTISDGYLIFRNSWGVEWGDNGYGYLPFAYFTNHGIGAYLLQPHCGVN